MSCPTAADHVKEYKRASSTPIAPLNLMSFSDGSSPPADSSPVIEMPSFPPPPLPDHYAAHASLPPRHVDSGKCNKMHARRCE